MSMVETIEAMRTIEQCANELVGGYSWAEVGSTADGMAGMLTALGYSLQQIGGKWVWAKATTAGAELASTTALATTTSLAPAVADAEVTSVVVSAAEVGTDGVGLTLGTAGSVSVGATAANIAFFGALALYSGYKFTTGMYEANPDFWDGVMAEIFYGNDDYIQDSDGNVYLPLELVQKAYDKFAELASGQEQEGAYKDGDGNVIPMRFAKTVTVSYVPNDAAYLGIDHIEMTYDVTSDDDILMVYQDVQYPANPVLGIAGLSKRYVGAAHITINGTVYKTDSTSYDYSESTTSGSGSQTSHTYSVTLEGVTYYGSPSFQKDVLRNTYMSQVLACSPAPGVVTQWQDSWNGVSKVSAPTLDEITGTTHPTTGGSVGVTYPTWYANKLGQNVGPEGVVSPTEYMPVYPVNDAFKTNATASTVTGLQSGTTPDPTTDMSPAYQTKSQTDQATQTQTQTQAGLNPTIPGGSDSGTSPSVPAPVAFSDTGMVAIYHPSKTELASFSQWLWSPNFIDNIKKIFQDPMSAIISLHAVYCTPTDAGTQNIIVGYLDSGVSSHYVTDTHVTINCGTIRMPEFYNNALDYNNYTQFEIYLPFVGFRQLDANDLVGATINVTYRIDLLTGTCTALIKVSRDGLDAIMYTYSGNCSIQIPLSSSNFSGIVGGLITTAASVGATILSGGMMAPLALGAAAGTIANGRVGIERSGSLTGNAGELAPRTPYLVCRRPYSAVPYNYQNLEGYPSSNRVVLGNCHGYTRVKAIHLDALDATRDEKIALEAILKAGVYI